MVCFSPGAGESSGTIMGVDAEYVATPGGTFPGSMRHLLVSCFHKEYFTFFSQSGKFATGTLVRHYTSGSWVPVIVDITTNHGGYFAFKVIRNGPRENIKMLDIMEGLYGYCGPPGCMNYLPRRFRPVLCMFDGN